MHSCRTRIPSQHLHDLPHHFNLNTLAHEAFHCVQNWVLGDQVWTFERTWIKEGMAEWAGDTLVPVSYYDPNYAVLQYVESAEQLPPVFQWKLGNAAVGFFGHVHDALGNLWPRLVKTLQAKTNEDAFVAAGGKVTSAFESWGSSRFRIPEAGPDWMMISPLVVPTYYEAVKPPTYFERPDWYKGTPGKPVKPGGEQQIVWTGVVGAMGFAPVFADEYTTAQAKINTPLPDRPIVRVHVEGVARIVPLLGKGVPGQERIVRDGELWLCAGGDCSCPAGSTGGPPDTTEPWSFPSALALTGPAGARVETYPLDWSVSRRPPATSRCPAATIRSGARAVVVAAPTAIRTW